MNTLENRFSHFGGEFHFVFFTFRHNLFFIIFAMRKIKTYLVLSNFEWPLTGSFRVNFGSQITPPGMLISTVAA